MEKKIKHIPRVEYIDGMSEIGGLIPYDTFVVFFAITILTIIVIKQTLIAPILGIVAALGYHRFKKRYNKNFYLTIPYYAGVMTPDGVPPVTEKEFME